MFYSEPDAVEYNKDSKLQHDLILGINPWKSSLSKHAIEYSKTLIAKGSIQNRTWSSTTDSIRKMFYSEPDAVEYNKDSKLQHDLILGINPWMS